MNPSRSATVTALTLLALVALSGCRSGGAEPAAVTVTETVTQPAPAPVVDAGPDDPEFCEQIEAQKALNKRFVEDGYADSYQDEYDQLLDANGCN